MPSPHATPIRFVDRAHILMSDGWVVRAASHPEHMRVLTDTTVALAPPLAASNPTTWTTPPRSGCKKRRATASSWCSKKLGIRRGKQRWSALVSAPTSRLAKSMRARLGDAHWSAFVRHANRHYKASYVQAFEKRVLRCVGPVDGGSCPHAFEVDLDARDATDRLECLHLDHERPVHRTCAWWTGRLPDAPQAWDDGLDGGALCHALFGVDDDGAHGVRCVRFRCGPRRDAMGLRVPFAQHSYCHTS